MEAESPYKSPEADVTTSTANDGSLMEAFLGHKNAGYYLGKFAEFESRGEGSSWHWPAFFFTWVWLGYRKMWGWFFGYWLGGLVFLYGVLPLLAFTAPQMLGFAFLIFVAAIFFGPPLIANKLYFSHARKKIAKAKLVAVDPHKQALEAARLGGTSNIALIILPFFVIALIGILAAIAIPAYQDYTIRAQVYEGLNMSAGAKAAVNEYIKRTDTTPVDNAQAGISEPDRFSSRFVQSVAVVRGDINVTFGNEAHQLLQGKVLYQVPTRDGDTITWSCSAYGIADKHLPAVCR